ncbi:uncharacterized protein PITG_13504 [Phytophthora infestans T30-4]|uniref:Uncharacterized protein n=1 Tax=Phytophthora infestans (strain T30-4) TaxID=403677 RepID=D0NM57_PHYIT|nr:uncharacterized protein PITG_13504 [Phytophthora infestans T30-4]EEY60778.1 hypothetical protein PITG_13504 [Phytophthora infestans T30-4]|eukprot:XP_002899724.1 hypothetical protein PITG_13504 [Phytophthora infestans T30-4]
MSYQSVVIDATPTPTMIEIVSCPAISVPTTIIIWRAVLSAADSVMAAPLCPKIASPASVVVAATLPSRQTAIDTSTFSSVVQQGSAVTKSSVWFESQKEG